MFSSLISCRLDILNEPLEPTNCPRSFQRNAVEQIFLRRIRFEGPAGSRLWSDRTIDYFFNFLLLVALPFDSSDSFLSRGTANRWYFILSNDVI